MEFLLSDLDKQNPKMLRKDIDGAILDNKYEIDYYRLEQFSNVVDNLMLGNYDEFGEYIVQDEIKEELIKCEKMIIDNYENILFVKTINPINAFSYINFAVKVITNTQTNQNTAILELLEPIYKAKGFVENTQTTILKRITLPNNAIFRQEVYKAFNIKPNANGEGQKIATEDDFKNTIDRKIRLLYLKKQSFGKMNGYYEICYNKNVEELKKTEIGKKVIEQTNKDEKIAQKYLNVQPNDFKVKVELLNKNIEVCMKHFPKNIAINLFNLSKRIAKNINGKSMATNIGKEVKDKKVRKNASDDMLEHLF